MNSNKSINKEKKIIGLDGRCLLDGNYTGVSEYTVLLIKKILNDYPNYELKIFVNSFKFVELESKISWIKNYPNIKIKHYRIPNKILNFCLWFCRYPKLDKLLGGVDIFIAPNISFLAVGKRTHFIITIHDLSFERFPETFSWKRRLWHFFVNPRKLTRQADEVWTVSKSTKFDLESLYKISSQKIKVKPLFGFDNNDGKNIFKEHIWTKIKKKYSLPDKFILYLGTIEPRKNILALVKAFEYLKQNELITRDYKLVISGQLGWKFNKIISFINKSSFKKSIILTDFVEVDEKKYLYHFAELFVYPSFFEGFGIPVLEAMINEVPIIASNNSSLPEVIGSAGIMIDPDRIDDLVEAINLILNDAKLSAYYIEKGQSQAKIIIKKSQDLKLF